MPSKPDAETATPAEGEVAGNIEALSPEELQAALGQTQELVMRQEQLIQRLAEQVEHLSTTAISDTAPPSGPPVQLPAEPREGWKRYGSRFLELTVIKTPGRNLLVDGYRVFQEAERADFSGGVYETGNPEMQAYLESHPDFNITFWEDPFAVKRHQSVEVSQGYRGSDMTPRAPLTAPMQ